MSAIEKQTHADLRRRYPLYVEVGLALTLALLVTAVNVEWRSGGEFEIQQNEQETVEMKQIEQTQQIEKPPPPPQPQVPVEVPNEESVEDATIDLSAELDVSGNQNQEQPPPPPENGSPNENEEPEIFMAVEQMPKPIGGQEGIYEKIQYPEMARKAGVEGRVVINFVVNENGEVVNPKVVSGLGAGCDEEALDAIRSTKFRPGKQRGQPVKVRMSQAIQFRLD